MKQKKHLRTLGQVYVANLEKGELTKLCTTLKELNLLDLEELATGDPTQLEIAKSVIDETSKKSVIEKSISHHSNQHGISRRDAIKRMCAFATGFLSSALAAGSIYALAQESIKLDELKRKRIHL